MGRTSMFVALAVAVPALGAAWWFALVFVAAACVSLALREMFLL